MEEYRLSFEQRHGVPWEFVNEATVSRYLEFKARRDLQFHPSPRVLMKEARRVAANKMEPLPLSDAQLEKLESFLESQKQGNKSNRESQ